MAHLTADALVDRMKGIPEFILNNVNSFHGLIERWYKKMGGGSGNFVSP
ncbi:MAG: hypothetical protein AB7D24_07460 [Sphaerochaeta sp.]